MHLSKSCGVKFWTVVHGGTTSILLRAEKVFKGGQEQMDGLGMPSDDTVTEEEGLEVDASWVLRLRDPCGFQNAWVNGKCRKGRGPLAEPLFECESARCRPAIHGKCWRTAQSTALRETQLNNFVAN